jgi:hypothetical protein
MRYLEQKLDQIVEIHRWTDKVEAEPYPEASRPKNLVYSPSSVPFDFLLPNYAYLFKWPLKRAPQEYFAEIIAYKIGAQMGLDVPHTFLAVNQKSPEKTVTGIISQWFYDFHNREGLYAYISGGDYLTRAIKDYDRKVGTQHDITSILTFCSALEDISERNGYELIKSPYKHIVQMFTLDTLIGNSDRHQDNWGAVWNYENRTVGFAPAFDNGSSLGFEIRENKLHHTRFDNWIDRYASRGCHHIRTNLTGNKRFKHFELIKFLCDNVPGAKQIIQESLDFDFNELYKYISSLCRFDVESPLSEERAEFIVSLIKYRYSNIIRIIEH